MSHAKIFQARPQASPEACRAHGLQNHRWQHPACENTRLSLYCCLCWLLHSWKSSQTIVDFFFSLRKHLTVLILHCNFNKICHRSVFWEEKKTSLALSWALCPVSFMLLKTDTLTTRVWLPVFCQFSGNKLSSESLNLHEQTNEHAVYIQSLFMVS